MNRYLKNLCELAGFNKPITRTCYRAGQRVEETFPKYEMIGTMPADAMKLFDEELKK